MTAKMQTTCWRGMKIEHPCDWELTTVGPQKEPGRCVFSDRRYQRLQVLWREVKYVPDLAGISKKFKHAAKDSTGISDLKDASEPWQGIVRKTDSGWVVNAGRFFKQKRWLAEVMFIWPGGRDTELENRIMDSISPAEDDKDTVEWQAMGLDITVPKGYDLDECSLQVGRIRWKFTSDDRKFPTITVERLAMASSWLKLTPGDWIDAELPVGHKRLSRGQDETYSHPTDWIVSRGRAGRLAALAGFKRINLDLAWICPVEDRLYHISVSRLARKMHVELPSGLCIHCCMQVNI